MYHHYTRELIGFPPSLSPSVSSAVQERQRPHGRCLFSILRILLLLNHSALTEGRIQNLLPDAEVLRRDLEELIGIDELEALLKAHDLRRDELQCVVRAGCPGVGEFLRLADIDLDILGLAALADDHTGIDLDTGADEELSSLLRLEEAVGNRLAALVGDDRTGLPVEHIALIRTVALELSVQDAVALRVGQELAAVSDQAARRDIELKARKVAMNRRHADQFALSRCQLLDDRTGKLVRHIDKGNLHRLLSLVALVIVIDDLCLRDRELKALATHVLD